MELQVPWNGMVILIDCQLLKNYLASCGAAVPFIAASSSSDFERLSRELFGRFEV